MAEHTLYKEPTPQLPGFTGGSSVTGYMHPGYAESLAEFGTPRELQHSGGWLQERMIPGSE